MLPKFLFLFASVALKLVHTRVLYMYQSLLATSSSPPSSQQAYTMSHDWSKSFRVASSTTWRFLCSLNSTLTSRPHSPCKLLRNFLSSQLFLSPRRSLNFPVYLLESQSSPGLALSSLTQFCPPHRNDVLARSSTGRKELQPRRIATCVSNLSHHSNFSVEIWTIRYVNNSSTRTHDEGRTSRMLSNHVLTISFLILRPEQEKFCCVTPVAFGGRGRIVPPTRGNWSRDRSGLANALRSVPLLLTTALYQVSCNRVSVLYSTNRACIPSSGRIFRPLPLSRTRGQKRPWKRTQGATLSNSLALDTHAHVLRWTLAVWFVRRIRTQSFNLTRRGIRNLRIRHPFRSATFSTSRMTMEPAPFAQRLLRTQLFAVN